MIISLKVLVFDQNAIGVNTTKCEIAGIGVLKGVQTAVCGMKCIDLRNEAIKILVTKRIVLIQSEKKRRKKYL